MKTIVVCLLFCVLSFTGGYYLGSTQTPPKIAFVYSTPFDAVFWNTEFELKPSVPARRTKLYEIYSDQNSPKELKDYLERTMKPGYKQTFEDKLLFQKYAVEKQTSPEQSHPAK